MPGKVAMPERTRSPAMREAYPGHLPIERCGTPQEVSVAAAFLASDAAESTGPVLDVDRGFMAARVLFDPGTA